MRRNLYRLSAIVLAALISAVAVAPAQTRTTSVSVSMGTSAQLTEKLQYTVDTKIEITRSTAIGINTTVNVPPRTRTTGLYGIQGYVVACDALRIVKYKNKCYVGDDPVPVRSTTNG